MTNVRGKPSGWGLGTSAGPGSAAAQPQGSGEQLLVLNTSDHLLETLETEVMCRLRINCSFMQSVLERDFHGDLEEKGSSEAWPEDGGDPVTKIQTGKG